MGFYQCHCMFAKIDPRLILVVCGVKVAECG